MDTPEKESNARTPFRPKRRRLFGRFVAALVVLGIVAFVASRRFAPKAVSVSPVTRGTVVDAVYATGTVEPLDRAVVKAKVGGSIVELKVREGDPVKKGDVLALIDSPTLRFDLERGRTDLRAAKRQAGTDAPQIAALEAQARATEAQLRVAREDRDRVQRLANAGSVARAELDRANGEVATLEGQLASQVAQRRSLSIDLGARASGASVSVESLAARLSDTVVRAPLDGVVLSRSVDVGEFVAAGQAIFRVGDISNLVLECQLDEADIAKVVVGSKAAVTMYAFADRVFHGEVFDIFPDADRATKSFLTKVRLTDAPEGMRSGMSAEVNVILTRHEGALVGPAEAVDATGHVWLVRNGRAEKRVLEIGLRDQLRVEIVSGAHEGDALVVAGADALSEGARVNATVKAIEPKAAAPSHTKSSL